MLFTGTNFAGGQKTLLLGLGLGNAAGLMLFFGSYPPLRRFLEAAFPYGIHGYYTGDFALWGGLTFGLLFSPVVLTLKARRFYCFWGLLPITIVFLWLAVGFGVAHRLNVFLDPSWAFPILFTLSWAISSFPTSLFRWFRRGRNTTADPSPKKPAPRPRRYLMPAVTASVLLTLALIGWHNLNYPKPLSASIQTSWDKGTEATVPLIEKNGGIFVTASLNGQKQICKIDTGGDTVNWIRDLHIDGEMTQERGQACDALNNCVSSATVKLPRIQIESYKVTDFPTEMLDSNGGLFSSTLVLPRDDTPTLGNALFCLTVTTIDYQHKTLTIRPPTYDFTKQARRQEDKILQMGWTSYINDSPARQQVFGWPVIRARVCGKPFWCVIDTGWEGQELGITKEFFQQLSRLRQVPRREVLGNWAYSSGRVPQLDYLRFQVAALSPRVEPVALEGRGWIVDSIGGGRGIIGTNLMERYRITIDYQRRRVLLEPYQEVKNTQKQEKRRVMPKLPGI